MSASPLVVRTVTCRNDVCKLRLLPRPGFSGTCKGCGWKLVLAELHVIRRDLIGHALATVRRG